MKLILASSSPRRHELLGQLGLPFESAVPLFEEVWTERSPGEEALHFATQKAQVVAPQHPDSLILASDTLIECQGQKIGKPRDRQEAKLILSQLSGQEHRVFSAVVLLNTKDGSLKKHLEKALVTFHILSEKQIEDYVATGEPLDKAGAYAIQGLGRKLVASFQGDLNSIVGLPLAPIRQWLLLD